MGFKSILSPVDGSPPSDAAVLLAVQLAKESGAQLTFCHAVAVPLPVHDAGGFAREQMMEEGKAQGNAALDAAKAKAMAAGVQAQTELLAGPVADAILDAAKARGCDVIVMGTHGRSGLARAVLGSKTADVIARSSLPILVAPHIQE
jgi:nucleotide-binding universal stress UspA family protein